MEKEENSVKRVFSSTLYVSYENYMLKHVEDSEYGHSTKRAFFEIIQNYDIPFEIEKRKNGEWLYSKKNLSNTAEIILFIADNLSIRTLDVIQILEHLLQNNIIEISKHTQTIKAYYERFKTINQFYESDYRKINSNLLESKKIDFKQETIMIKNIDIDFYAKSSHAVKIVIDAVFYHMLSYIRGLQVKRESVEGKFKGCLFSFQGYEKDFLEQSSELLELEKIYESFDLEAKNIKKIVYFNSISKYLKGKYGF